MGKCNEAPLGERLGSASAARQALQAWFQAGSAENDLASAARQAERRAIFAARAIRLAERETERAA
ncbi:DUF6481 family protein [Methylobacterium platani]|uniref:DUF6481 family protein n=1 Tax=Methylobacterium platani TaxID=427683 RepID=UPI000ABBA9D7|nr:DUF6481 family protein [Methylobacterium platani]